MVIKVNVGPLVGAAEKKKGGGGILGHTVCGGFTRMCGRWCRFLSVNIPRRFLRIAFDITRVCFFGWFPRKAAISCAPMIGLAMASFSVYAARNIHVRGLCNRL